MNYFIEGFLLQASLVLALGAQNIFVLESGLKKERQFLVATLCSVCDLVLIAIGVMGAATIFVQFPRLKIIFGVVGVLFLIYYGIKKLSEGFKSSSLETVHNKPPSSKKQIILLSLGFSLLNPHVYLDTIVLIGGYSAKFPEMAKRIEFGAGAAALSAVWFFGLVIFASSMSALLNNPKSMKVVSIISGLILIILAYRLGLEVYSWVRII